MSRLPWICFLFSLHACSAENYVLKTQDTDFCIPHQYVVEISTAGMPDAQYDSEGRGYGISLIFKSEELASAIDGYQKIALRAGIPGYQPMYVMLSDTTGQQKIANPPPSAESLESAPRLLRLEQDDIAWRVAENIKGEYIHWGYCSSTFDTENNFDCTRDFETGKLQMSYQIHQQNLKVYSAIDVFLASKTEAWKCHQP